VTLPQITNIIFFRLSEQAQRQLEKRSTKFEDITLGENRPTELIKRYGNLYAEGRLEAMDALDDLDEMSDCDDLKTKLLLSVIVVSRYNGGGGKGGVMRSRNSTVIFSAVQYSIMECKSMPFLCYTIFVANFMKV